MNKKKLEGFIKEMDNKTIQKVYENCLDLANENKEGLIKYLKPTPYKNQDSKNSLSFEDKSALSKYFGIEEDDLSKLDNRITTIHSSALLAFLAFYKVSKNAPINIFGIDYTQRFFEVKNECIDQRHPSQVDVVLADKEWNNVLYLESKFTEPLTNSKAYNISADYKDENKGKGIGCKIYNKNFFDKDFGLNLKDSGKGNGSFNIEPGGTDKSYLPGIKQMISHYIGILNGPTDKDFLKEMNKKPNICLASIVYDFTSIHKNFAGRVCTYGKLYKRLAQKLNNMHSDKNVHVLEKLLTYQDVFSNENNKKLLSKTVKDLYKIGK